MKESDRDEIRMKLIEEAKAKAAALGANVNTASRCARDLGLEILCVSQFTLYHVMKGNKPDFHLAMGGDKAKDFYEEFLTQLRKEYGSEEKVKDGVFGAMMKVDIANDGPVTLEIESPPPTQ